MEEYEKKLFDAYIGQGYVVQENVEYYKKVFAKFDSGKKFVWSGIGFFMGLPLMAYRNQKFGLLVLFCVHIVCSAILPFIFSAIAGILAALFGGMSLKYFLVFSFISPAVIAFFIQGFLSNKFIYNRYHKLKAVFKTMYKNEDEKVEAMKKAGCVHNIAAFLSFLIYLGFLVSYGDGILQAILMFQTLN